MIINLDKGTFILVGSIIVILIYLLYTLIRDQNTLHRIIATHDSSLDFFQESIEKQARINVLVTTFMEKVPNAIDKSNIMPDLLILNYLLITLDESSVIEIKGDTRFDKDKAILEIFKGIFPRHSRFLTETLHDQDKH